MRNETRCSDLAPYYFHQGTNYNAWKYLGHHFYQGGCSFRVWAPNADEVYLVGDFNGWSREMPLSRVTERGVWEIYCDGDRVRPGQNYKFLIIKNGRELYKADPYAFLSQKAPETASVTYDIRGVEDYPWNDGGWMEYRRCTFGKEEISYPLNIYELHTLSWKRGKDGEPLSWGELARELAPYVKQMGYTHVELMPISEFPFEGSWGYQVTGYFSPTSRLGRPDELCAFVDAMHCAGIGVILDWVPAHFPKDAHGLYEFDGVPLYEYQGKDRMEHRGWGTRKFDVGREEVQSFLVSSAVYWIKNYHIDGLRVDAVASMLYLDYDKLPGEWVPNVYGDNRCLEAISFFKKFNSHVRGTYPDVLTIAEESSAFSHITGFEDDGLGFTFKWNMGWMNDVLSYAETDHIFRCHHHNKITFSLTYAFGEKYVLPISHDEVVHCKKSLLDRMPGDYWRKFAGARAFAAFMITHPGKKLNFMGNEIGQFREWDYEGEIEWFLLDYEMHAKLQLFYATVNHFYLENPALWEIDDSWKGFDWIDADNSEQSIFSYVRRDKAGRELLVVVNMTPATYRDYKLGVPTCGEYVEVINSDDLRYGGSGVTNRGSIISDGEGRNGRPYSINISVPPLAATVFKIVPKEVPRKFDVVKHAYETRYESVRV